MTSYAKRAFGLLHDDYASTIAAPVSGGRVAEAIRTAGRRAARQAAEAGRRIKRAHRRWKTVRQLQALDDRTLKDIGIDRGEIDRVVRMRQTDRANRPLF